MSNAAGEGVAYLFTRSTDAVELMGMLGLILIVNEANGFHVIGGRLSVYMGLDNNIPAQEVGVSKDQL